MGRTRLTQRHRADQAARLNDTERAHAAAGVQGQKQDLDQTTAFLRAKLRREVQAVFDELTATAPGAAALKLVVGMMGAQAAEEARLLKQQREAMSRVRRARKDGDEEALEAAKAEVADLEEELQQHRRATRHLTHSTDAIMRAVKVHSELRLSGAPNAIQITGAATGGRERLTALPQ